MRTVAGERQRTRTFKGRFEDPDGPDWVYLPFRVPKGVRAISVEYDFTPVSLGPTSAIRFAGEAVLVDFRPVTNPYEIRAVGDPGELSAGFLRNEDVQNLGLASATFGLRFDYTQQDEIVTRDYGAIVVATSSHPRRVAKRPPMSPFNGFGKRLPSEAPPVLTPAERDKLKAQAEADGQIAVGQNPNANANGAEGSN